MNIFFGVVGFLLIAGAFLSSARMFWISRGIHRRQLSQDQIVRATVVKRLRNLGIVLTQCTAAVCCFLLAGFTNMTAGTAVYANRQASVITMLITTGVLLLLTLVLFCLSRQRAFNFMQVLREYIQRRSAREKRRRQLFRRRTKRRTNV